MIWYFAAMKSEDALDLVQSQQLFGNMTVGTATATADVE